MLFQEDDLTDSFAHWERRYQIPRGVIGVRPSPRVILDLGCGCFMRADQVSADKIIGFAQRWWLRRTGWRIVRAEELLEVPWHASAETPGFEPFATSVYLLWVPTRARCTGLVADRSAKCRVKLEGAQNQAIRHLLVTDARITKVDGFPFSVSFLMLSRSPAHRLVLSYDAQDQVGAVSLVSS